MMRVHYLLIAALCGTLLFAPPARAEDDKPIRALLICGGCCHDYTKQKDILTKGISARANVEWTIFQEGNTKEHKASIYANPDWAKGYDVIVHDECYGAVTDDAFVEAIVKVHAAGLPAVALHCSAHSYRAAKTTAWSEMLGIRSMAHGPQLPIEVTFLKKDDEITKGMKDWTTDKEELYNNIKIYDHTTPLARGRQMEKKTVVDKETKQTKQVTEPTDYVVVWTNDFHGTRVFCTTLGHGNPTVADDRYLDLVTRGLLWSVKKLDEQHLKPAKKVLIEEGTEKR